MALFRRRSGVHVEVRVFGDVQFSRKLLGVGKRARRARPVFDSIGHLIQKRQQDVFRTSGQSAGRLWAPLEPRTVEAKTAHGSLTPARPLEDTGASRDAWRYGDENSVLNATDDSLEIGVKGEALDHSQWHQPDAKGRYVFPPFREDERREITRELQHWIVYGEVRF